MYCIPSCITNEDNELLAVIPELDEIKEAVFGMSDASSEGPNGYTWIFFYKCWDIIKEDINDVVQELFNGKNLTKFFYHTCLVLIPKVDSPSNFSKLRPISLSNFSYKIISKKHSRGLTLS